MTTDLFLHHMDYFGLERVPLQVPQVASTVCHQIEEELQGTLANVCALVEGSQHAMYRCGTVLHLVRIPIHCGCGSGNLTKLH